MTPKQARRLVGRTIVAVELNEEVIEGERMTSPLLTLDDGSVLSFYAQESPDGGEYGVGLVRSERKKKR